MQSSGCVGSRLFYPSGGGVSTVPFGTAALVDALEALNQSTEPTFAELLQRLYEMRFQGTVSLNFAGGLPRSVVLNQPVQVHLDTLGVKQRA